MIRVQIIVDRQKIYFGELEYNGYHDPYTSQANSVFEQFAIGPNFATIQIHQIWQ